MQQLANTAFVQPALSRLPQDSSPLVRDEDTPLRVSAGDDWIVVY
jgi:hypothetical protein